MQSRTKRAKLTACPSAFSDYVLSTEDNVVTVSGTLNITKSQLVEIMDVWGGDVKVELFEGNYKISLNTPMSEAELQDRAERDKAEPLVVSDTLNYYIALKDRPKWTSVLVSMAKRLELFDRDPYVFQMRISKRLVVVGQVSHFYFSQLDELSRDEHVTNIHVFPENKSLICVIVDVV